MEDDDALREAYRRFFEEHHADEFRAAYVADGEQALGIIGHDPVDVVVLDWALPGISGASLAKALRSHRKTQSIGIIMVTAKSSMSETVVGLDAGADDYLPKPFDWNVLLARLRSLSRRSEFTFGQNLSRSFPGLELDVDAARLTVDGRAVSLTPKEFDLLSVFLARPGVIHSHAFLWEAVWGYEADGWEHTLVVTVSSLRRKLGPPWGERLTTLPGRGYSFDAPS
ncbi:MAG: response regulator transcription factor [Elusimicrobia bacterium]|nr:response regulator transcription factor [Elusimicrobiota bacterium]